MVFGGFGGLGGRPKEWGRVGRSGGRSVSQAVAQSCPSLGPVLAQSWPSHSKEKLGVILHLVCGSLV